MKTAEERIAFLITANVPSNGKLALQWFSTIVAKTFEGPKDIVGPLSESLSETLPPHAIRKR